MGLLIRILKNRIKEYLEFKWEIINIIISDSIYAVVGAIFWHSLLNLSNLFDISLKDAFIFLFYQNLVLTFLVPFYNCFMEMISSKRQGRISLYLTYPKNFFYFIFSRFWLPLGPLLRSLIFPFLSLMFGLKINSLFFFGIFVSFLTAVFLFFWLFFFATLSFYFEAGLTFKAYGIIQEFGKYPTHIYKGFLFFITNILLPAFAFGTASLVSYKFLLEILKWYLIYCLLGSITLYFSSIYIFRLCLKRYEAYGV